MRITDFALPGNDLVIEFAEAVAGSTYRLERKFDLAEPNWQPDPGFADFVATANGAYAIYYPDGGVMSPLPIFYRITLLP